MSAKSSLAFRELSIRRTPGITTPYTLADLCPSINIIYGPNASGKSTSAEALLALLWSVPPAWKHAALSCLIHLDGSQWHIDFDAGMYRCQCDGIENARLGIGSSEARDQYVLTLHDLLQADNKEFAATILRESTGGYDIDAAVNERRYVATPARPASLITDLTKAHTAVQAARQAQSTLVEQQNQLQLLRQRRAAAGEAQSRVITLERAMAFKDAQANAEAAKRHLAAFPDSMKKLTGQEPTQIKDLRARLLVLRERRNDEMNSIATARGLIEESGFASNQIRTGLIADLRARCQQLQGCDNVHRQAQNRWADAQSARESARRNIADQIDESQLNALTVDGLRELVSIAHDVERVRAEEMARATLEQWVGQVDEVPDLDRLREAISRLNEWLRTPENEAAPKDASPIRLAQVAAALVVALALVLVVEVHWLFAVIGVVGVVLLLLVRKPPARPVLRSRQPIEQEFSRLGVGQPANWTVDEVEKLRDRLQATLRTGIVDEEKANRWANLAREREAATANRLRVQQASDALVTRCGLTVTDSACVYLLAQNLDHWQRAQSDVEQARGESERTARAYADVLANLNEQLEPFGCPSAADHTALLETIEQLDGRLRAFTDAQKTIDVNQRALEQETDPEIAQLEAQVRRIFASLDLAENDDPTLTELIRQLDDYREAKDAVTRSDQSRESAALALDDNEGLKNRTSDDLELEHRRVLESANQYDGVSKEIVAIETLVDQAKQRHDIERALNVEQAARAALSMRRDEAYGLAAGWQLGDFVRTKTRDRDRPQVFHRARELFSRITYGRYRLEFSTDTAAEFRATDTTTNVGHALNELSSATRVQLLMAVRLAFVEVMEQGPKLPLILDEVLGNSDEHRARAIIDATIEICRSGRQIFYFTAQHDEVAKWTALLRNHDDVPHISINLAEVRGLADNERLPPPVFSASPLPEVPAPNGSTHREYRDIIGVPGIDPWAASGGLHLWYVVSDTGALYQLLSRRVTTWGQLQTLVEYGGANLIAQYPGIYPLAEARANILSIALDGWRAQHGKPVDRAVLLESRAITDVFIDKVAQLAHELGGDATKLIEQLEAHAVAGFRGKAINDLREYCSEQGYLPSGNAPSSDDIHMRALATASGELEAGLLNNEDVDSLLNAVGSLTETSNRRTPAES